MATKETTRRVLVTGSSSGIGRATAARFAAEGAAVAVHGRNREGAEETAAQVRRSGGRAEVLLADLSEPGAAPRLVRSAVDALGGLDVLVNNAGMQQHKPFLQVQEEDFDRVVGVDLRAAFFATREMVEHLREQGRRGVVVNVSSVHQELPFPGYSTYAVAKAGLGMMTRTLAVELAGSGVRIAGVAPGAVWAGENEQLSEPQRREVEGKIPLGRIAKPEEVASAIAFLASPDASYVHGATLFVDGALTWSYEE